MGEKTDAKDKVEVKTGDVVLDRYRVVEQIASGGHSVVYLGTDERLSRPVCIKVFSGLGGQSGVGRTSYEHFVQEAFALSRLTHPNTLRIYDFGHLGSKEAGGMPLQVCEYMNGGTLSNVIRERGKQSLVETVRIVSAMCAALSEAHALGIVHRDIKPQNILFGTVGTDKLPKLADFGIAKWGSMAADEEADRARRAEDTAIVAGQKLAMYSPSWAAPEQLAGQPVSAATDIYSLAAVAVYMLSGKAVFADEDVYAGYKKRRHADELVRDALAPLGVPKAAIEALSRALAFDPKKRLAKVESLAQELAQAIEMPGSSRESDDPEVTKPLGKALLARAADIAPTDYPRIAPGDEGYPADRAPPPSAAKPATTPDPDAKPEPKAEAKPERESKQRAATTVEADEPPPRKLRSMADAFDSNAPPEHPDDPPGPKLRSLADAYPGAGAPRITSPGMAVAPPSFAPQASGATPAGYAQQPPYHPPQVRGPWMNHAGPPSGGSRRVVLSEVPQVIADRRVHFVLATNNVADLLGTQGMKLRVSLMMGPTGNRIVHLKGMSCFVAPVGGRPSPAFVTEQPIDVALVTPRAQDVGHVRVLTSPPFTIGSEPVTVAAEDCLDPILFDFGPGSDAYFVYTRGRTLPVSVSPSKRR